MQRSMREEELCKFNNAWCKDIGGKGLQVWTRSFITSCFICLAHTAERNSEKEKRARMNRKHCKSFPLPFPQPAQKTRNMLCRGNIALITLTVILTLNAGASSSYFDHGQNRGSKKTWIKANNLNWTKIRGKFTHLAQTEGIYRWMPLFKWKF